MNPDIDTSSYNGCFYAGWTEFYVFESKAWTWVEDGAGNTCAKLMETHGYFWYNGSYQYRESGWVSGVTYQAAYALFTPLSEFVHGYATIQSPLGSTSPSIHTHAS